MAAGASVPVPGLAGSCGCCGCRGVGAGVESSQARAGAVVAGESVPVLGLQARVCAWLLGSWEPSAADRCLAAVCEVV